MEQIKKLVAYKGQTKTLVVNVCNVTEYDAAYVQAGVGGWSWYTRLGIKARGFLRDDGVVFLLVRDERLLAHEVGHLFGLTHPNTFWGGLGHAVWNGFPTMAFTSLLRWVDSEGLVPIAREVLGTA